MTKKTLVHYLTAENKTLGNLLLKFNRLQTWNTWLRECLPNESALFLNCKIVGLDKTALIVMASNPHWVTRFRFFIPDLLIKLRNYPDFTLLRSICCKVKPVQHAPITAAPKREPLQISAASMQVLQETAKKIQHKKLQLILEKMAERGK